MVLHDASDKRLSNKNKIGLSPIPDAGVELSYVVGRLLFAEGLMQGFNWSDLGPVGSHFVKPVAFLTDWDVEIGIQVAPAVDGFAEILFQGRVVFAEVESFYKNTMHCVWIILFSKVNKEMLAFFVFAVFLC